MSTFSNAPISNFVVLVSAIVSICALAFNVKELFSLDSELLSGQWWRLFTFPFSFVGFPEMFFGLSLLYSFRTLERQMGTSKYGIFAILSFTVSSILALTLLFGSQIVGGDFGKIMFSGPYGFIFSSLVLYYHYIPPLAPIPFFGIRFNDKIFTYLSAIVLLLSYPPSSIYYAYCGVLAGMIYLTPSFESRRVPKWLSQLCDKYFGPLLSISPSIIDQTPTSGTQASIPRGRPSPNVFDFDTVQTYYSSPQNPRLPSPQHIEYLISMGAERERAIQVLMRCDDDLNVAIENLFPSM